MLPSSRRLRRTDFVLLKKNRGEVFSSNNFNLKLYKTDSNLAVNFSVVVSSLVSKKAVARNRLKRRVKGFISRNLSKIKNGFTAIIYVKKQEFDEEELAGIFKKSGILK